MTLTATRVPDATGSDFDTRLRFVTLREVRPDGFIEFDFAIGEPELSVELILPAEAFRDFCRANRIEPEPSAQLVGQPVACSIPSAEPATTTSSDHTGDKQHER